MARQDNNIVMANTRGMIGGQIVFRKDYWGKGDSILAAPPQASTATPSAAQQAQRDTFRSAVDYAKVAQTEQQYIDLANASGEKRSAYQIAMSKFFGDPTLTPGTALP